MQTLVYSVKLATRSSGGPGFRPVTAGPNRMGPPADVQQYQAYLRRTNSEEALIIEFQNPDCFFRDLGWTFRRLVPAVVCWANRVLTRFLQPRSLTAGSVQHSVFGYCLLPLFLMECLNAILQLSQKLSQRSRPVDGSMEYHRCVEPRLGVAAPVNVEKCMVLTFP